MIDLNEFTTGRDGARAEAQQVPATIWILTCSTCGEFARAPLSGDRREVRERLDRHILETHGGGDPLR